MTVFKCYEQNINMKKFLIAVILLIPVILILALNGASTIVAINTPDNPTKIEIRDKNNVIIKDGEVLELDLIRDDDFIIINIFPEINQKLPQILQVNLS